MSFLEKNLNFLFMKWARLQFILLTTLLPVSKTQSTFDKIWDGESMHFGVVGSQVEPDAVGNLADFGAAFPVDPEAFISSHFTNPIKTRLCKGLKELLKFIICLEVDTLPIQ